MIYYFKSTDSTLSTHLKVQWDYLYFLFYIKGLKSTVHLVQIFLKKAI